MARPLPTVSLLYSSEIYVLTKCRQIRIYAIIDIAFSRSDMREFFTDTPRWAPCLLLLDRKLSIRRLHAAAGVRIMFRAHVCWLQFYSFMVITGVMLGREYHDSAMTSHNTILFTTQLLGRASWNGFIRHVNDTGRCNLSGQVAFHAQRLSRLYLRCTRYDYMKFEAGHIFS